MKRKQFTFYRSFYEALECLPKAQQLEFLKAVIAYALDGEEPQLRTKMQKGQFTLIRPVLKKSRQKALNGLKGAEAANGFAVPKGRNSGIFIPGRSAWRLPGKHGQNVSGIRRRYWNL